MSSQKIAYVRVSTEEQNFDRQLPEMEFDKVFKEKLSAASKFRPQLLDCLEYCRCGDQLFVHSIDRLARDLRELQSIVSELVKKGVSVHFVSEKLNFSGDDNPMSTLTLQLMGAFAEFERTMIKKRQAEGIAKAKAAGKYKGRKGVSEHNKKLIAEMVLIEKRRPVDVASIMKVSLSTVYKAKYEYEKKARSTTNT